MVSVCIVGAGAAGLCAARLLSAAHGFNIVVFEQSTTVGGTWRYTDDPAVDPHSSMYCNLRTNLPKEIMGFPDYPFPESGESFVHHTKVLKYLEHYAIHYELLKYIKFKTRVKHVTPKHPQDNRTAWIVTVEDLRTCTEETSIFDAVFICNGHYSEPYIPYIPGLEKFSGKVFHSHVYRKPDGISGPVLVLGASSSGIDISLELAAAMEQKIYLSSRKEERYTCELPPNVIQVPGVSYATEDGFVMADASVCKVKTLILCTGYCYSYPFLSKDCKMNQPDHCRVNPLYKHLIHMDFHTLYFLGIPLIIVPFPIFYYQVKFCMKVLDGTLRLPTRAEMERETSEDLQLRLSLGMPERYQHKMGDLQWNYVDNLSQLANVPPLPQFYKQIYEKVSEHRKTNILGYREANYSTETCDRI
ncbi:uncharacterized protein LOC126184693 [Schistocerca cancellata]|uniref:uncharacterized protein LOC126184693 n=1 Tax=Schistocerca cancellata TaxID=274614 RepID=UPI002118F3E1|nr:uncharacterized protein LOC126184693 [Schistocerca cancellata]XP_049783148.1 uncharacterized protein LOC126184693 [Schistocerca cancellata]XP_049783149.1 uncharacterized protein LOC126184693 [Schistocerca cancellata]XP_049783150.1 uncharacterized protein LOC126184693 [Schistocerca cancellata]XP_049783151.1 uncharacterized protein LOC126184693 [Schistocerca cancellata]